MFAQRYPDTPMDKKGKIDESDNLGRLERHEEPAAANNTLQEYKEMRCIC